MPKENDLEGRQDMGGKHGGQAGMPKPEERSSAHQASFGTNGDKSNRRTKSVLSMSAAKTGGTIRLAIKSSEQCARRVPGHVGESC